MTSLASTQDCRATPPENRLLTQARAGYQLQVPRGRLTGWRQEKLQSRVWMRSEETADHRRPHYWPLHHTHYKHTLCTNSLTVITAHKDTHTHYKHTLCTNSLTVITAHKDIHTNTKQHSIQIQHQEMKAIARLSQSASCTTDKGKKGKEAYSC